MTEYTELQIIKHALQYYMMRPYATPNDKEREQHLLSQTEERIDFLKDEYSIEEKQKGPFFEGFRPTFYFDTEKVKQKDD